MSDHTPGPWRDWNESLGAVMAPRSKDADWGSRAVALVAQWPSAEERAANARLIAAAPDMLAALKGVVRWGQSYIEAGDGYMEEQLRPVEAIIEEVEGG